MQAQNLSAQAAAQVGVGLNRLSPCFGVTVSGLWWAGIGLDE